MSNCIAIIGAPSSAGAYGPGQEKAPTALRSAGLLEQLSKRGINYKDRGNISGFRWQVDKTNPRAMNAGKVESVAREAAEQVALALEQEDKVLVLGGDCTVELGTVAGAVSDNESVGLIYIDLDTDLNTPESTDDGALDWMGVAHMLGIEGCIPEIAKLGPQAPLLTPAQILFFGNENVKPFERHIIEDYGIEEMNLDKVISDPSGAAKSAVDNWGYQFDRLLIHLDVDVLDYLDMPLAENYRRNTGLKFCQLMEALQPLLKAPNFTALTITEINPDHADSDGFVLRTFAEHLSDALADAFD